MKKLLPFLLLLFSLTVFANEDSILTWEDVPLADEFHVQRKFEVCALPDTQTWVGIWQTDKGIITYTDPNIGEGLTVCYRVAASAVGGAGISAWSNRAEKIVPFVVRGAPVNLQVR